MSLDLDAIRAHCKTTRDVFYHVVGVHYVVREADFDALVAEVERLRELLLNAGWPREAEGIAELALQTERAAVVAWLRSRGMADYAQSNLDYAATMIERGDHRREGEE